MGWNVHKSVAGLNRVLNFQDVKIATLRKKNFFFSLWGKY